MDRGAAEGTPPAEERRRGSGSCLCSLHVALFASGHSRNSCAARDLLSSTKDLWTLRACAPAFRLASGHPAGLDACETKRESVMAASFLLCNCHRRRKLRADSYQTGPGLQGFSTPANCLDAHWNDLYFRSRGSPGGWKHKDKLSCEVRVCLLALEAPFKLEAGAKLCSAQTIQGEAEVRQGSDTTS